MNLYTGLKNAKENGKILGRPRVQIDWEKVKEMKEDRHGLRKIAKALNISKSTMHRYLKKMGVG